MTGPRRRTRRAVGLLLMGLALLAACKSTAQDPPEPGTVQDTSKADPAPDPPADFALMLGQGGGFAGLWEGYAIAPDGAVTAWKGYVAGDNAAPADTLTAAQRQALWERIEVAGFFDYEREETGNITAFLEVTADGRTHRASWIPRVEGVEEITDPVERLYLYCRDVARAAGQEEP